MKDFNSPHSSAKAAVSTVRKRTMKVGKRLEKSVGTIRGHALAELERAKCGFWNGQTVRGASEYIPINALPAVYGVRLTSGRIHVWILF
jgi:hypothetical protein